MDFHREKQRDYFFLLLHSADLSEEGEGSFFPTVITIIPDCDGDPAVIIDVLLQSCTQRLTPAAPQRGDRVSVLQIHMKEPIPEVLLLSCNEKRM